MSDGSEKRSRQLAFELHTSHVCEKRSNNYLCFLSNDFCPLKVLIIESSTLHGLSLIYFFATKLVSSSQKPISYLSQLTFSSNSTFKR